MPVSSCLKVDFKGHSLDELRKLMACRWNGIKLKCYDCLSPEVLKETDSRDLIFTPFEGCYGVAGWVLCMNGSPPRCTIVLNKISTSQFHAFVIYHDRVKSLRKDELAVVVDFHKHWLAGENKVHSVRKVPRELVSPV